MKRPTGHIVIDAQDAWELQKAIKNGQTWNPTCLFSIPDVYHLRQKINSAILEMEDTRTTSVAVPISETECQVIDFCVSKDDFSGAKSILTQTFRVMWETEYSLPIQEIVAKAEDQDFNPVMLDGFETEE